VRQCASQLWIWHGLLSRVWSGLARNAMSDSLLRSFPAMLIGDHAARNAEQPRQLIFRNRVEPSPSREKGLCYDIIRDTRRCSSACV
jgi:hypothetical protein